MDILDRTDMMEPAPSTSMDVSGFHYPMASSTSNRFIRRVPRADGTVNGLSNFSILHREMPYHQYPPREFVQMPPTQSRNIFVEENRLQKQQFKSSNLNNNHE